MTATAPPRPSRRTVRLGWAYFGLFVVVHVVLAVAPDGLTPGDVVELVLVTAAAALLALPRPMAVPVTVACVLALLTAAAIGSWSLPPVPQAPDYRSWVLGAVTFVALGLAFRGRYLAAWFTLLCTAGIVITWSVVMHLGPLVGAGLIVRHFGTLLAGTLIAVALDRSARSAAAFEATERQELATAEAARARRVARQVAAQAVLDQAGPLLEQLAEGHPLDDRDRRELLVVEGALRDRIRAAGLLEPGLQGAVAAARRRGIDVLVLDEAGASVDEQQRRRASEWLTTELGAARGGRFVGRLVSREGAPRVSAVTDAGSRSLALGADPASGEGDARSADAATPVSRKK
jgi:hypothetical protein